MADGAIQYRDLLAPVGSGTRPLWSVMIPTFNCAAYLTETLQSVLVQDPGPDLMQIEVVDDASTLDKPEEVVRDVGKGRVGFFRQPRNLGHTGNFRTCLERSRGQIVHLLHGDDAVVDGFYQRLQAGFTERPDLGAAFCRHVIVDQNGWPVWSSEVHRETPGVLDGWLEQIAIRQLIQTPSIVVRRDVYERLGFFDKRLTWCEDWEMWCRIAANYPVWFEPKRLAMYRSHGSSSTSGKTRSGETLRDVRRGAAIIRDYLPADRSEQIWRQSMRHWAKDAIQNRVPNLLSANEVRGATNQLREALNCDRSPQTLIAAAKLGPRFLAAGLRAVRTSMQHFPSAERV